MTKPLTITRTEFLTSPDYYWKNERGAVEYLIDFVEDDVGREPNQFDILNPELYNTMHELNIKVLDKYEELLHGNQKKERCERNQKESNTKEKDSRRTN